MWYALSFHTKSNIKRKAVTCKIIIYVSVRETDLKALFSWPLQAVQVAPPP